MKPAPFEYQAPTDLDAALSLLATLDGEVKILAGGQSLVPLLNFRLARPDVVVDIGRIPGMRYVVRSGGELRIGALTSHADLESSPLVRRHWPMLTEAAGHIAHPQIRNAGTVGGSLAHADPSAELPAALAALDTRMVLQSRTGVREVGWREFFRGYLETALRPDEILMEVVVPALPPSSGCSFTEYARRNGDFALGGAAVRVSVSDDGYCSSAAVALLGAGPTPLRAHEAEAILTGSIITDEIAAAASTAAVADVVPTGDLHAGSAYRHDLLDALVFRSILTATVRANGRETRP